jgi:hypothetical protein
MTGKSEPGKFKDIEFNIGEMGNHPSGLTKEKIEEIHGYYVDLVDSMVKHLNHWIAMHPHVPQEMRPSILINSSAALTSTTIQHVSKMTECNAEQNLDLVNAVNKALAIHLATSGVELSISVTKN